MSNEQLTSKQWVEVVDRMRSIAKAIYSQNAFRSYALDDLADQVERLAREADEPVAPSSPPADPDPEPSRADKLRAALKPAGVKVNVLREADEPGAHHYKLDMLVSKILETHDRAGVAAVVSPILRELDRAIQVVKDYDELLKKEQPAQPPSIALLNLKCRFGCTDPAVVLVEFDDGGCVCWPDKVQALCAQHWQTNEPIKGARAITSLAEPPLATHDYSVMDVEDEYREQQIANRDEAIERLEQQKENLLNALEAKQARIDALMLEYCPGEMSASQRAAWCASQELASVPPAASQVEEVLCAGVVVSSPHDRRITLRFETDEQFRAAEALIGIADCQVIDTAVTKEARRERNRERYADLGVLPTERPDETSAPPGHMCDIGPDCDACDRGEDLKEQR